MAERTITLPEGVSEEEIQKFLRKAKRISERKTVPYMGYACGKTWLVTGSRYEDAKANVVEAFMGEFGDLLPLGINRKYIWEVVGVRKLGPEWIRPIDSTIEELVTIHNSKPRRRSPE